MKFSIRREITSSFSLWFQSWCSFSLRRDFLKVSVRLKFSRYVKKLRELAIIIYFFIYIFFFFLNTFIVIHINVTNKKIRRKFSIVVTSRAGENFRSRWWRSVSSPLQVSGAVTRLTVDRATSHSLQRRGSTL